MSDPFVSEIQIFGFNFAPRGWAFCQGQVLSISQNTALFSLLGTNYGGNGQTTFALPNLATRAAAGQGQGQGLSPRDLGEQFGTASVTLLTTEMPSHNHAISIYSQPDPAKRIGTPVNGAGLSFLESPTAKPFTTTAANAQLAPNMIGTAGSSVPHENRQPYLGMNFCIALQGVFPARN